MSKRGFAAAFLAFAILTGAYATADAYDVVPGVLTTKPPIPPPPPYPQPTLTQGALEPPPAPSAHTSSLQSLVDDFAKGSEARGTSIGIRVVDLQSGEQLAAHDATAAHTTASSIKLLPASAVLLSLPANHNFATDVLFDEPSATVTLVGHGDLRLSKDKLTDAANDVARAIGQRVSEVAVTIDDRAFLPPYLRAAWGELDRQYVQPVMAMAIDSGQSDGAQDEDPALSVGEHFATALTDAGLKVSTVSRGAASQSAEVIAVIASPPLADLVRHTLKESDNTMSEALARLTAIARGGQGSPTAGPQAVIAALQEAGFSTAGVNLADTCGLDGATTASAEVLTDLLVAAANGQHPNLHPLLDALPVANLDGTLATRMEGLAGSVRAKTGTLVTAVSLSGIGQHTDGSMLVFSVLMDDIPEGGVGQARAELDTFISQLLTAP